MQKQLSLIQKARELPERQIHAAAFAGESHVVHVLGVAFVLCIVAYIYFVGVSITNVISNREASVESERLQSVVAGLEEDYFELAKSVTPEAAVGLGLTASADTSFVRRTSAVAANAQRSDL